MTEEREREERVREMNVVCDKALQFIVDMILSGKISIFDVPREIRQHKRVYYISAFRLYRKYDKDNRDKRAEILELLAGDILELDRNDHRRKDLIGVWKMNLDCIDREKEESVLPSLKEFAAWARSSIV